MHRTRSGRVLTNLVLVTVLTISALVPLLGQRQASAYGLITTRSIKMSNSVISATSVSYDVLFTPSSAAGTTVKSIAVDFCAGTPIIGDTTCVQPTGMNLGTPTFNAVSVVSGAWTAAKTNTNRTFTLTNSTGANFISSTPVEFEITGVTNTSTLGTFYARIYTFPNDVTSNFANGYTPANIATNVPTDAGGIALSTAAQINVTAKVQERLTFCVYTTGAGNDCTGKSGTAIALGDTNGVLDVAGPYVDKNAKYTITTNASGNATIRMKGTTLTSGAASIAAMGNAATASVAGTDQFGLCTYQSVGSGLTPQAPYNHANCSNTTQTAGTGSTGGLGAPAANFAFDNSGTGTTSTYGDDLAVKAAGNFSTGIIAFVGNVSSTAPAGIYTTALTFIATGSY